MVFCQPHLSSSLAITKINLPKAAFIGVKNKLWYVGIIASNGATTTIPITSVNDDSVMREQVIGTPSIPEFLIGFENAKQTRQAWYRVDLKGHKHQVTRLSEASAEELLKVNKLRTTTSLGSARMKSFIAHKQYDTYRVDTHSISETAFHRLTILFGTEIPSLHDNGEVPLLSFAVSKYKSKFLGRYTYAFQASNHLIWLVGPPYAQSNFDFIEDEARCYASTLDPRTLKLSKGEFRKVRPLLSLESHILCAIPHDDGQCTLGFCDTNLHITRLFPKLTLPSDFQVCDADNWTDIAQPIP